MLDRLAEQDVPDYAVGKISDIFLGRGITHSSKTMNNADGMEKTAEAMRWQADSGQQYSLSGGYFIGPAWDGHAYIDGNGLPPTAVYLNQLWASGLRPA